MAKQNAPFLQSIPFKIHLCVVICFQISIFEPLETTEINDFPSPLTL